MRRVRRSRSFWRWIGFEAVFRDAALWIFVVPLVPLLVIVVGLDAACRAVYSGALHLAIWWSWCRGGRDILLVYSDSPVWRVYVEQRILPQVTGRAVVLNWSQRAKWRLSLARMAFAHFGGSREFNPLAVVFRPFGRTRTFRFWRPFRDFKHGNPAALDQVEREFLAWVDESRPEFFAK